VVTNTYANIVERIKGQGGPVQYVFDEPVITYVHPVALAKSAPHPSAGKLLMSFILSADGQKMLRDQGRIRPPKSNQSIPAAAEAPRQ
jgi:ABC-type Fe3+ transport system substrate-binding protein